MGRSQRRMINTQGYSAAGYSLEQGAIAPGLMLQALDGTPEDVVVPGGAPGGPLQGSSLTGGIPADVVVPPFPEPPPAPVVVSIDPISAAIGDPDLTLTVTGTGFLNGDLILFNNSAEETVFVSETELTTTVKPSTASTPGDYPVAVRGQGGDSNAVTFTFDPEAGGLTAPEAPINITSVRRESGKLIIVVDDPSRILPGLIVTIEATGNTSVNGQYTVESVNGNEVTIPSDYELANPIEAKGRLLLGG